MTNKINVVALNAKYKQARSFLLLIVIFSVINLVSVAFANTYFLFSAYLTQIIAFVGAQMYLETGGIVFLIIFGIIGLVTIVPYLLCYIFSKKRVGWMLAAMILFAADSALFLIDFVSALAAGEPGLITDFIIHGAALFYLIYGVVNGKKLKAAEQEMDAMPENEDEQNDPTLDPTYNAVRQITVRRKKKFAGMAVAIDCYVDDQLLCSLKNGEEKVLTLNENAHTIVFFFPGGNPSRPVTVPEGIENYGYEAWVKTGMVAASIEVGQITV